MSAMHLDKSSLSTLARAARTPIPVFEAQDATLAHLSRNGLVFEFQGLVLVTTEGLQALYRQPIRRFAAECSEGLRKLNKHLRRCRAFTLSRSEACS